MYFTFFLIFFKRQKCLLPFTKVAQTASTIMYIVLNKAGLNFDIPRNNVPIVRKVTYLLGKGGKMRDVSSTSRTFYFMRSPGTQVGKLNVT